MMRKNTVLKSITAIFITIILTVSPLIVFAVPTKTPDFGNDTKSLLLTDIKDDNVLFSQESDTVLTMASTTKIMTYIIAAEKIDDLKNTKIEINQQPIDDISNQGASTAGFQNHVGQSYSALDILYGLMLPSGCDAAQILAYYVGGDNAGTFVDMMNAKAVELGCTSTHYVDAHGLSSDNKTTASDLYKIAKYALDEPYFRTIISTEYYTLPNETNPMINSNYLVDEFNGRQYYYQYTIGIKTGYTSAAGKCLVSLAKKGDTEYLCVALGGKYSSDDNKINHAMVDTKNLFEWAFENFTENINIEFDKKYISANWGQQFKLTPKITSNSTSEEPNLKWSVIDGDYCAIVDDDGFVSLFSAGVATIKVETQTGNFATCKITSRSYNGIDVTSSTGDYSSGTKQPINWGAIKDYGIDYAIIRAGWMNSIDTSFKYNVENAAKNNLAYGLSFTAYADNGAEATEEAQYLLKLIDENIPDYALNIALPIAYNMSDSRYKGFTTEKNLEIATAFNTVMKSRGYKTMIYANKTTFAAMDIYALKDARIGTYCSYCPDQVDFSSYPTINDDYVTSDLWLYRGDGYILEACDSNLKTRQCLASMSYTDLVPIAPKYGTASVTIGDNTEYFSSFEEALDAADGKTAEIKLLKNEILETYFELENKDNNFTIDFGENTLSFKGDNNYYGLYYYCGNYTLKGNTGGVDSCGPAIGVYNYGTSDVNVKVEGGVYKGGSFTTLLSNKSERGTSVASLKISGGTFKKADNCSVANDDNIISDLLDENCAYKLTDTNEWLNDNDALSKEEINETVTVKKHPIKDVNITSNSKTLSALITDVDSNTVNDDSTLYQWYKYDSISKVSTPISGATNSKYIIDSTSPSGDYYYIVKAEIDDYAVTSEPFKVSIVKEEAPTIPTTIPTQDVMQATTITATVNDKTAVSEEAEAKTTDTKDVEQNIKKSTSKTSPLTGNESVILPLFLTSFITATVFIIIISKRKNDVK